MTLYLLVLMVRIFLNRYSSVRYLGLGLIHSACFINHVTIGDVRTSPEETMPEPNPVDVVPSPATSISTPSPVKMLCIIINCIHEPL